MSTCFFNDCEYSSFSGIPQNLSDASCATQYKMAVEGVSGNCGDVNMFIHDSSGDEQTYITHLNDNYFHTKFKIDPNELYTFHDSDVIAGEITVSHSEDNFVFPDNSDVKSKLVESREIDIGSLTNGETKEEIKNEVVSNGHYPIHTKTVIVKYPDASATNIKESKTPNTKVQKSKSLSNKELNRTNVIKIRRSSTNSLNRQSSATTQPSSTKTSITSPNSSSASTSNTTTSTTKLNGSETFLDVFKREQGLVESPPTIVKTEPGPPAPPLPKIQTPVTKKTPPGKY